LPVNREEEDFEEEEDNYDEEYESEVDKFQ
jgi:hypothetical protein